MMYDSWLDITARRDKRYDGMEGLPASQLALHQWHDGWRWFDIEYPDEDTAADQEFIDWHKSVFECGKSGGRSIGAGHECICTISKGHRHKHGCECGASWGKE